MTTARKKLICLESTPFYHCTNRCVRRAYLTGDDPLTNRNFDHRQKWIEDILQKLTDSFCIEVAGFSIQTNHYHILVKINANAVVALSDIDVLDRWSQIYSVPASAHYFRQGYTLTDLQAMKLNEDILHWRSQLTNLSRFMGYLNERIARRANKEDNRTGRFWESRFTSKAVTDVNAVLQVIHQGKKVSTAVAKTG